MQLVTVIPLLSVRAEVNRSIVHVKMATLGMTQFVVVSF